jgi:hypothetical protein
MQPPSYQSSLTINTPLPSASKIIFRQSFLGSMNDFTSSSVFSLNGQETSQTIVFKADQNDVSLDFTCSSPFSFLRQLNVNTGISYKVDNTNGKLMIKYNDKHLIDADFTVNVLMPLEMTITVRQPVQMEFTINLQVTDGGVTGVFTLRYNNLNYRVESEATKIMTQDIRGVDFKSKVIMPSNRDMTLNFGAKKTADGISSNFMFQWANIDSGKMGYDFDISLSKQRNQVT